MGLLYGCWLDANFDPTPITEKLRSAHKDYFDAYKRRTNSICALAEGFIIESCEQYPSLSGKLTFSYTSVISAIGRYINDVMHYKLWHDVKVTNKAKMIAHTIKWLSQYHVINVSISASEYQALTVEERKYALEINTFFVALVIRYFLSYFCNGEIPSSIKYSKMFYLIETGQYDVKTAAVAFDGMIL